MNDFIFINDNIAIIICFLIFIFTIYKITNDNGITTNNNTEYDYLSIVVNISDYKSNIYRDKIIELKKRKEDNTYILNLDKEDGYYTSFHVVDNQYISIETNKDKSCKFNNNKENTIPLINKNKVKIIDPD